MFPERSDATRIAVPAQGPCLFGVPVPARAFGFAPGWQLSSRCWSTIDLRGAAAADEQERERLIEDAVRVMGTGMDAVQPLLRTAPVAVSRTKRTAERSRRPASQTAAPTNRPTTRMNISPEVAAA